MKKITVVISIYNEQENIKNLYERLTRVLSELAEDYEIILIDDGSVDNSWKIIEEINSKDGKVRGLRFTRNFGQHVAITAGLDYSKGDYIVLMDADLQDQPEEIPKMLSKCRETGGIVYALRRSREDASSKKLLSRLFYLIFNRLSAFKLRADVGVFRVISRLVRDNIVNMREQTRIITGLIDWLGFPSDFVEVDRPARITGKTKYNFGKLMKLGMEGIMAFSNIPLRFATYLGFFISLVSLVIGLYFLVKKVFFNYGLTGWPSLFTAILFLGGVELLVIGILGEYIGKIFIDVKNRPLYIISKEI